MRTLHSFGPEDTWALGAAIGRAAFPGTVVALQGELGAGKTVLAKGIGAGLAVTTRVQSPSFILVQAHLGGRLPFWHVDLYRVGDVSELEQLGLDELVEGDGVTVIEWAERLSEAMPPDHLQVHLEGEGNERAITIRGTGPRHRPLEEVDVC
ncbi:MAG: tRNA (adenosine(37)-N6)-threonylcarbamoyltransferase complex ATPase subunit type 1 TsaE [Deltaproteobacteria bacterium]|nr:tRNA (adenosine(37)-N6)-threonylcarbamoyltransferase complex ATPase subunit type 1 TsaE [Deltaproteobacteria bacterium]MBW2253281.1 tRNA (adenosine(37)-N6)-threonylcarbamoyltransferase complex ATPase subunit type 1 TsaE [Deltaproteobacteria bacterium]